MGNCINNIKLQSVFAGKYTMQIQTLGIYAYKDTAFARRVSPQFKLYLVREFERSKKEEQDMYKNTTFLSEK